MTSRKFVIFFSDGSGEIRWNDSDENCDRGSYVAPLPWKARHGGWVLSDALTVAVMRAQETEHDSLLLAFCSNPARPDARYRVQPDGDWWHLGAAADDAEFVGAFNTEQYL